VGWMVQPVGQFAPVVMLDVPPYKDKQAVAKSPVNWT